ncbi:S4 domain-containing protein, partial [Oribacterium sinus]
MRLDKYLSDMGVESRSVLKREIRKGLVRIDGEIVKDPSMEVQPGDSEI